MRAMLLTGHGGLDKLVYREDCLAVLLGLDPSVRRCRGAQKPKKAKVVTRTGFEPSARFERPEHIAIEGAAERRLPFAQGNIVREVAPSTPDRDAANDLAASGAGRQSNCSQSVTTRDKAGFDHRSAPVIASSALAKAPQRGTTTGGQHVGPSG